ncbi:MAG: hypothetical protein L0Y58_18670 [Verrucomicrobia subdivision 3 bacterium]|nr:hypothetical protein [Limisphaerales bacterium]
MDFLRRLPAADVRVPAIALGEIKQGVQSNPTPELCQFLEDVLTLPVAPFDEMEALVWGEMTAEVLARGRTLYVRDSLIAATARVNAWTVATRNVGDFANLGVRLFNPFTQRL